MERGIVGCLATCALTLGTAWVQPAGASAPAPSWPMFGHDLSGSRSAGSDGPSAAQVASLPQAWSFSSSNGDFTGTPVVADGTLVAGTNLGTAYALDAVTGHLRWSRDLGNQINGSAAIDADAPGGPLAFVPVARIGSPHLVALSLATGAVRWDAVLTRQPTSDVFGSPAFWRGTVYMGTSGPNNDEASSRGSVVALDEASGAMRWQTFTVPPGYDGGAVWSTPAIDTGTGRLYVGTGNAYHSPAADTTDAMLVLSAASGQVLGHFQATAGDVWELQNPSGGPDYDFGSSPNLFLAPDGRALVGEGQKSGTYWALDRATMQPVWRTMAGPGGSAGGGVNSTAFDGRRIYGSDAADAQVFALGRDGSPQWNSVDVGTLHFSPVAVGNGVVYSADTSGFLTARDAATGSILAKLPLGGPTFAGLAIVGGAVYTATGTGPPPAPDPSVDTSRIDGSGTIVAFGATATPTASPAPRSAAAAEKASGPSTFSGTCALSGVAHFAPPLTNTPQQESVLATLQGTCSGTLTDAQGRSQSLSGAEGRYVGRSGGSEACGAGTAAGSGTLTVAGRRLAFSFDEVRAGPAVALVLRGAQGGSALGQANVSPSSDPVAILQACAAGGLGSAPLDGRVITLPSMTG